MFLVLTVRGKHGCFDATAASKIAEQVIKVSGPSFAISLDVAPLPSSALNFSVSKSRPLSHVPST